MDFDLTEAQKIMKQAAHDFLSRECPKRLVRQLEENEEGYSRDLWRKLAELGWMGLIVPEGYGGSGGSFLDLAVLLEEMGYAICPGPFFSSVVLGGLPILMAGNEAQKQEFLPALAEGRKIFTLALHEPDGGYDPSCIKSHAVLNTNECIVRGVKLFVADALLADYILCVARTREDGYPEKGITIFIIDARCPGITRTPLRTLSWDKQCEVVFDDVKVSPNSILGEIHRGWTILQDILEKAALCKGAEMLGGAQAVMDMTLAYARDRVQFDHPIGSFQAIQHYCADMWIDISASRMLLYKAACEADQGTNVTKSVAMAKARIGDAYRRVTALGHQIFGGIGFTMEHDMHLYHRRSISGDLMFGSAEVQREKVALELGL